MWTKLSFEATWTQDGGSGSKYTRADLLSMSMDELVSHVRMVQDRRQAESQAVRDASKAPRKRS